MASPVPPGLRQFTQAALASATGNFHSICVIGEGGFGKVYRAMIDLLPVAIKVLDQGGLQGMDEFYNEARLLSSLDHPNLVRLIGVSQEGPFLGLVYELAAQGNLEDRLAGQGGLPNIPWQARLQIAAQMSAALAYLHSRSPPIIHHDFKPANVFLDSNWNAKVGDMGLADAGGGHRRGSQGVPASSSSSQPAASSSASASTSPAPALPAGEPVLGTWSYLAPEYAREGKASPKTDVYAFGITLLQLVTGVPEPRGLLDRCRAAVVASEVPAISDSHAGSWDYAVAARLLRLGLWCCQDTPHERPAMNVLATELGRMLAFLQQSQQAPAR